MKYFEVSKGIEGLFINKKNSNTTLISVNFYMPLDCEEIAANSLLPYILTSCSERYQGFSELNKELSMLYGADLSVRIDKAGDNQYIKISISVLDDCFALEGEAIVNKAVSFLMDLILNPRLCVNSFYNDDIEREKRKLEEHILGEINDKRNYARNRLISEMFSDTAYGVSKYGTIEEVKKIDGIRLYKVWKNLLTNSHIRIQVVGETNGEEIIKFIGDKFKSINRSAEPFNYKNVQPLKKASKEKIVSEKMDITQGKLVMGFSSDMVGFNAYPLLVATDIFGGGPYSKLFSNVREKMSLCYYCSASANRTKGYIMVDSGVEGENVEKAKKEIINQLEDVKKGNFDDFVFSASIKSLTGALTSYNDSLSAIDSWYSSNIFPQEIISPEAVCEKIYSITRQEVIDAAKGINLHTVYQLIPKGENYEN